MKFVVRVAAIHLTWENFIFAIFSALALPRSRVPWIAH